MVLVCSLNICCGEDSMTKIWKKFEPLAYHTAENKIKFLLDRGGRIVNERKEFVEIQRQDSIAKIDQWGRVEWRAR